ncbi:maguk p55 subfamily member 6 isoform x2 [Limosa lapponica baueri]|uniref:Maguk p55 subfamily member 6 isoform x2 n=1 Tax=Limosa lapponica baueri TaxID=1758121 RepID=A0A2I0T662_LIMLA|nr:maguk p55 subfamily member 6 isoform x2 [Limosa lapponica baueri]
MKTLSESTFVSPGAYGVTFRVENNDLVIARILHGGMIDRQGLLHVGDIIKEVNGHEVGNNPKELQELLKNISGSVTLKILPSYRDTVIPQQASHVKEGGSAGLIPSQFLEEKRKAFVRRDWDNSGPFCGTISSKKKKKMMYLTTRNAVTSRKPRDDEKDGQAYRFVSRAEMEMDIKAGRYLEHGEYEGNLYGTKIDSILEVVQTGRTCILDVNPQVHHL